MSDLASSIDVAINGVKVELATQNLVQMRMLCPDGN